MSAVRASIKSEAVHLVSGYYTGMNSSMLREMLESSDHFSSPNAERNDRQTYNWLMQEFYHNEAYIKSALVRKMMGGKHIAIFEYPVCGSRADIIKINRTSEVYEIKTAYDTLARLEKQVLDYSRVFDKVYVVCHESKYASVADLVPFWVGIDVYKDSKSHCRFTRKRIAAQSPLLDSRAILACLSTKDLRSVFGKAHEEARSELIERAVASKPQKEISQIFRKLMKLKYSPNWSFLKENMDSILEIDYQWFYRTMVPPGIIY